MNVTLINAAHPYAALLRGLEAANEAPPPEPGFRADGESLTYTTARGVRYVLRDEHGRPALIPTSASIDDDPVELTDPSLCILAEAADQLDAEIEDGWYSLRFALFYREASTTLLVYATEHGYRSLPVPEVPADATRVDVVPEDAVRCVSSPRAPVSGGDHG